MKLLLEKAHIPDIKSYEVWKANGGYASVDKAFKMTPEEIVEEVKKSGLRGRGGAGLQPGGSGLGLARTVLHWHSADHFRALAA